MFLKTTEQMLLTCPEKDKTRKVGSPKQANNALIGVLNDLQFVEAFECWQTRRAKNAIFRSIMNYLHCVESILFFVAASRNADLILHMQAAEELSKLFFAFDRNLKKGICQYQEVTYHLCPLAQTMHAKISIGS